MATSATIEQLLGLPALMALVEQTTNGLPQEDFLPKSMKTTTREVIGNQVQAVLVKGQRKVSRLIQYNAAPVGGTLETIARGDWIAMHTSEELDIDPVTFQRLRNYENWQEQKLGAEEIARQVGLFVKKQENLVSSVTLLMFANGVVYSDIFGNLTPTSVTNGYTYTMDIPASHQGQLPYPTNPIVTIPWNNPTADIPDDIRKIKFAALQSTGYKPTIGMYGINLPSYMQVNSYCMEYLSRNDAMNAAFMSNNAIPQGFLDIMSWIPAWEGFWEDQNGNYQQIWGNDLVTFLPEPQKYWYEMIQGSMQVPKTIDILTNVEAAMANIELVYGKFIYAHLQQKPIRLTTVMGNTFLPTIKVPDAIWQLTCVF